MADNFAAEHELEPESCDYCCFNCDSLGGGYYKPHEEKTQWFLGLDASGQANYACAECSVSLFSAHPVRR